MKQLEKHQLSITNCWKEVAELHELLSSKAELDEQSEILPFFRTRRDLAAFLSMYATDLVNPDCLAFEYDLFGDFACDLVIGDSGNRAYLLIEFEDANKNSLFKNPGKYAPDWSSRLEHGYSQIIDWFWKLGDSRQTLDFEHRFGSGHVTFHGLLIIGRDQHLTSRESRRLKWRQDHLVVDSKKISVITFDRLAADLSLRLERYSEAAGNDFSRTS